MIISLVLDILDTHAPNLEVLAHGSRVKGNAARFSDLDLALVGDSAVDWRVLTRLRAAFDESDLPFRVDVLDWASIPEEFRRTILEKYEVMRAGREGDSVAGRGPCRAATSGLGQL